MMGMSFLLSCWSFRVFPFPPAAFWMSAYHREKSVLPMPCRCRVLQTDTLHFDKRLMGLFLHCNNMQSFAIRLGRFIQGIVHLNWKFAKKNLSQPSQDVDEFVSSSEKCSIQYLAEQWILCSEWVPSEWVKTADKNITIIHTTPEHKLMSWVLNICKKSIHH